MTTRRRSANIYDYPEHLNPFHEDDNHTRLRFWTVTKRKPRSNSFSFQSIKDFKGSLSRSFSIRNKNKSSSSSLDQTSQIENDPDEVQIRVSPTSRQSTESYSAPQRLSVTPLPRSRFHERVRNSENPEQEKPEAKTDSPVSTPSTEDNNPFNDEIDEEIPSKPVTPARKKKRAPPPPPMRQSSLKAKSLTDYKAAKQNEENSSIPVEKTDTPKEEIETLSTTNIQNHVNIEIRVEEVTDVNEQEKEIKVETNVEEPSREEADLEKGNTSNEESAREENLKLSVNEEICEQQKEIKLASEDNIPVEELEKIEANSNTTSNEESTTDAVASSECINFNSETSLSSSHSSLSSEAKLEVQLQQDAVEDTSDLLELVTKLKLEVDKLTDDTNNNIIETEEERTAKNIQSWIKLDSPSKVKTELNVYLASDKNDDDDDVVTAPMSPRLVRLRKDNEWIRQQN